jgi:hypothetical protein
MSPCRATRGTGSSGKKRRSGLLSAGPRRKLRPVSLGCQNSFSLSTRRVSSPAGLPAVVPHQPLSSRKTRIRGFCRCRPGRPRVHRQTTYATTSGCPPCGYKFTSGRTEWLSRDPIGEAGGINLYAYVENAPIVISDQFGLDPGDLFLSPDEAAEDALRYLKPYIDGTSWEWGGWIYEDPCTGAYSYTTPVTSRQWGSVRSSLLKEIRESIRPCKTAGWYHGHKWAPLHNDFSADDQYWTDDFGVPGFLLSPDDTMRVIPPRRPGTRIDFAHTPGFTIYNPPPPLPTEGWLGFH